MYHYGRRSNRFLLINYGFCFENNKFDSYEFFLRTQISDPTPHTVLVPKENTSGQLRIRLKRDQLNTELLSYIRDKKFGQSQAAKA